MPRWRSGLTRMPGKHVSLMLAQVQILLSALRFLYKFLQSKNYMAKEIILERSYTFADLNILPGRIYRDTPPDKINLEAPMVKYNKRAGEKPLYTINPPIVSAAMQCISGTSDNIEANLAMYRLTGIAGVVNCTQSIEREVEVIKKLKQAGAEIIPAAISTQDYKSRIPVLIKAGADIFFVDTSQGMSDHEKDAIEFFRKQKDLIRFSKYNFPIPIIGGNIVTAEGFDFLVSECGADGVKEGMGSGRGCTTPYAIGLGRDAGTATEKLAKRRDDYYNAHGIYVPIYVDGGVNAFSDIVKALAVGGDVVMIGRMIAGTPDTPNPIYTVRFLSKDGIKRTVYQGPAKEFYYEASNRARMNAGFPGRDYSSLYEEGIEGWVKVPVKNDGTPEPLEEFLGRAAIIARDATRKAGCKDIETLHTDSKLELAREPAYSGSDLDVAIWPHEYVEVCKNEELTDEDKWIPAKELNKFLNETKELELV